MMGVLASFYGWLAAASVPAAPISALVISFAVYSAVGWLWESTVCRLLTLGHFANSGFLLGPCCPIYGVGGIACWLALRWIPDSADLFLAAMLLCCAIEYLVGLLLEHATGARFWDYSHFPFNIQGRVCLYGGLLFGSGALGICRVLQPVLNGVLGLVPAPVLVAAALAFAVAVGIDAALSLASWRKLSHELDELRADLAERIDEGMRETSESLLDRLPEGALDSMQGAHVRGRAINGWLATLSDAALDAARERFALPSFVREGREGLMVAARKIADAVPTPAVPHAPKIGLRRRELRFFNAFPGLKMPSYEGVIRATRLRDRARELFRKS